MEDILALILIFGGGTLIALAFSPVGRALADRIRGHSTHAESDPAVYEELERLRNEVSELSERMDFNERLLARTSQDARLPEVQ